MKLKIYLDTNIVFGYFKYLAEKRKTVPFIISFIEANKSRLQPVTSFFTLAEAAEALLKEGVKEGTVLMTLRNFRKRCEIKTIERVVITGEIIKWILKGISVKDAIQICIAKSLNAHFLTQDKKLIKSGKAFYQKILNFQELLSLLSYS